MVFNLKEACKSWVSFHFACQTYSQKTCLIDTNATMHALTLTPVHALKVIPTKHTLKLLFGLPSRKQVSPLNLTIVMATTKWVWGGG